MALNFTHIAGTALATSALLSVNALAPTAAQAFTFNQQAGTVTFDASSLNRPFEVFFDGGNVGSSRLTPDPFFTPDLKATVTLLMTAFNGTSADFTFTINNRSGGDVTASRLSVFGFNVDTPDNEGVFSLAGTRTASAPTRVGAGQTPQGFGDLDACFKNPGSAINNCNNGQGGATSPNGAPGSQTVSLPATLAFTAPVSQFTLSDFYVRYQSIDGTFGGTRVDGASGVGVPGRVPTPALLPGLLGLGAAAFRKFKHEESEQEA